METTTQATATESAEGATSRRQPCPCGSGKRFKNCCEGKAEIAAATPAGADAPASNRPQGLKPAGHPFSRGQDRTQNAGRKANVALHRRKV